MAIVRLLTAPASADEQPLLEPLRGLDGALGPGMLSSRCVVHGAALLARTLLGPELAPRGHLAQLGRHLDVVIVDQRNLTSRAR